MDKGLRNKGKNLRDMTLMIVFKATELDEMLGRAQSNRGRSGIAPETH